MPTLVGVFDRPTQVADAARSLQDRGHRDIEIFSPVPAPEVAAAIDPKPSRVRLFTLIGGLLGVTAGYAMTIWMSYNYPLVIGGKPYASIPPYTVIAFELTILFGGLATLLGLLAVGRLPRRKTPKVYDPRFSGDEFGLAVTCPERDVTEVDGLMRAHAAKEVNLVEA